ncbi:MAG: glycine cleavage system protein, partial [Chloroflexi bacterium]|nr:glycine cleavage system protein [Chloroflexota bacterium]
MARRHTPYYHHFVVLGGELVDRIGFDSALKFSSTEAEHKATREKAGLYDVYYQVLVDVKGADAEKLLQRTLVNNVERMVDGKPVGTVTSADRGYFLGRSLALG